MTTSVTLADMARNLAPFTGRTVVDKTGLAGSFDIDLTWTPEPLGPAPDAPPPADDGASLFTAVREQLGLKLEPQRGPVDVLVIDSAARPLED